MRWRKATACSASAAGLLLMLLSGGCVVCHDPGGTVQLKLRDARTGAPLEGGLLLRCTARTGIGFRSIMGGSGYDSDYDCTSVRIVRIGSGCVLRQQPLYGVLIPLGLSWLTDAAEHDDLVYRPGYLVQTVCDVASRSRSKEPLIMDLEPERPGLESSDSMVMLGAQMALPRVRGVPDNDPLKRELIELIAGQLARVVEATSDELARIEPKRLLEAIKAQMPERTSDHSR